MNNSDNKQLFLKFGSLSNETRQSLSVEHKQTEAPRHYSATGYGDKIPTTYMVKYLNVWRRVYCRIFSNIGSLYVIIKGEKIGVLDYDC